MMLLLMLFVCVAGSAQLSAVEGRGGALKFNLKLAPFSLSPWRARALRAHTRTSHAARA